MAGERIMAIARLLRWLVDWFGPVDSLGYFEGTVDARWLDNGRDMELMQDFVYVDPAGKRWLAPKGSVVNGASIPRVFWSTIGGPFEGKFRNASVVHDVACDQRTEPWEKVHLMFYQACLCAGVRERLAKLMYFAVYRYGPRWQLATGLSSRASIQPMATERDVQKASRYFETNNPSLAEIRGLK